MPARCPQGVRGWRAPPDRSTRRAGLRGPHRRALPDQCPGAGSRGVLLREEVQPGPPAEELRALRVGVLQGPELPGPAEKLLELRVEVQRGPERAQPLVELLELRVKKLLVVVLRGLERVPPEERPPLSTGSTEASRCRVLGVLEVVRVVRQVVPVGLEVLEVVRVVRQVVPVGLEVVGLEVVGGLVEKREVWKVARGAERFQSLVGEEVVVAPVGGAGRVLFVRRATIARARAVRLATSEFSPQGALWRKLHGEPTSCASRLVIRARQEASRGRR